jgi:hypothetical protein
MDIKTKLTYDFQNFNFSTDDKLKIIRKHENMLKDTFLSDLNVILTSDSKGDIWYKIIFYLNNKLVEFCYSDKTIFLNSESYDVIRKTYTTDTQPFYNHPVYFILDWLFNDGSETRYTLLTAISFIYMIFKTLNTMVSNYGQWTTGID